MSNLSLFPAIVVDAPATEGIKYAGSKLRLLPYILERLIRSTAARWIILSYSSGGRATAEDLHAILHANGRIVDVMELDHRRNVMASMKWTNEWLHDAGTPNREFLFLIDRG